MIDTSKEQPYSAAEMARLLAEKYQVQRSEATIGKWMVRGVKCGDSRAYLDSIVIGRQRCSSLEAYERFIEKLNPSNDSLRD